MDKDKLQAARKRLKEFKRSKRDQFSIATKDTKMSQIQSDQPLNRNSPDLLSDNVNELSVVENNISKPIESVNDTDSHDPNNFVNLMSENFHLTQNFQENATYNGNSKDLLSENVPNVSGIVEAFHKNQLDTGDPFIQGQKYFGDIQTQNNGPPVFEEKKEQLSSFNFERITSENINDSKLDELKRENHFLSSSLEYQKNLAEDFQSQIRLYSNKIKELEETVKMKDELMKNKIEEIDQLKNQIQLHIQTTEILVTEKTELNSKIFDLERIIKQKTDEVADLFGKLKISNNRITDIEKELASFSINKENNKQSYEQLEEKYNNLHIMFDKLRKDKEDTDLEKSEILQKLEVKNTELSDLQQELQEKMALLSLSELRAQQLANVSSENNNLENEHQKNLLLGEQLSQMKETLKHVSSEKEEANKQYQNYIQQLDEKIAKLNHELESSKKIISDSKIREKSYIDRLSEMELLFQREKNKEIKPVEDQSEKIDMLTKSMDNLVLEQENLQMLLTEKDNVIESLKRNLSELEELKQQSVDALKLATALQGEKLGASRAVSQNNDLKCQLDEMHDAFIQLSNTKLDLTEQLQAERVIGRKLNARLNEIEDQVSELKEELRNKDASLAEYEKEKFYNAQIQDQMQHYQAQSHNAVTLEEELRKSLIQIEILKNENENLQSKINSSQFVEREINVSKVSSNETSETCEENLQNNDNKSFQIDNNLSDAFQKLEKRFKETMERVADLTDEKQRLEHLVLQLQGETETIGEYITLYQKQRAIIQERAKERERTFRQVVDQRNNQLEQLHKLKNLIIEFLRPSQNVSIPSKPSAAGDSAELTNKTAMTSENLNQVNAEEYKNVENIASRIFDILADIKDCNDTCNLDPSFHPCPWCSGKLITV